MSEEKYFTLSDEYNLTRSVHVFSNSAMVRYGRNYILTFTNQVTHYENLSALYWLMSIT